MSKRKRIDEGNEIIIPSALCSPSINSIPNNCYEEENFIFSENSPTDRVITAIRIRPMSDEEVLVGHRVVTSFDGNELSIIVKPLAKNNDPHGNLISNKFRYDHVFWSVNETHPNYSSQSCIYDSIGGTLISKCLAGINSSLFLYGQTGSGKTYTMMGNPQDVGLVPRICQGLFQKIYEAGRTIKGHVMQIYVSYYEIYNEKVYDLLSHTPTDVSRVREHPNDGVFVENLNRVEVHNYNEILTLLEKGMNRRQIAVTLMNNQSSRSHTIFTLYISKKTHNIKYNNNILNNIITKVSKMNLYDLAGSETCKKSGTSGHRLVEEPIT